MAHPRRSFGPRGRTPRRKKTWVQAVVEAGVGLQLTPLILTGALIPGVDSFAREVAVFQAGSSSDNFIPTESTVLRIRGQVEINKSTVSGADIDQEIGFGIATMDLPTLPFFTDDLPGSLSAPEWDGWMFVRGPSLQASVDIVGTMFDVKAMRKIEGGKRLVFVTEVYSRLGVQENTPSTFSARGLLALP